MPCKRFRRESGPLPFSRHFLFYMKIQKLTKEEIETLQVDAVLRLLGGFTNQLIDLNAEISQAIIARGRVDIKLQQLKNDKQSLVEICRNIKVMVSNG